MICEKCLTSVDPPMVSSCFRVVKSLVARGTDIRLNTWADIRMSHGSANQSIIKYKVPLFILHDIKWTYPGGQACVSGRGQAH